MDVTKRRGIFWQENGRYFAGRWDLIGYYANSLKLSVAATLRAKEAA
jgi:hypothetical protein